MQKCRAGAMSPRWMVGMGVVGVSLRLLDESATHCLHWREKGACPCHSLDWGFWQRLCLLEWHWKACLLYSCS